MTHEANFPPPPISIPISKELAKGLSVGSKIKITIDSEIEGVQKLFDDDKFRLELKSPAESIKVEMNKADKALKEITGIEVMNEADRGLRDSLEG